MSSKLLVETFQPITRCRRSVFAWESIRFPIRMFSTRQMLEHKHIFWIWTISVYLDLKNRIHLSAVRDFVTLPSLKSGPREFVSLLRILYVNSRSPDYDDLSLDLTTRSGECGNRAFHTRDLWHWFLLHHKLSDLLYEDEVSLLGE